ncbi:hypothetical protein ACFP1Z_09330 [Streptomyces gamaensis]|uniref:Uncharacterized protein n=1 Tax=Streptomyces gamaensis TaxID=1763542 RepID=A0ABW0YX85_9ACTN
MGALVSNSSDRSGEGRADNSLENPPEWQDYGQTYGAVNWETVAATVALVPFIQALASTFGEKLAGAIGDATRASLRRFIRQHTGSNQAEDSPSRPISLVLDGHDVKVEISEDTPAEAMAQLLKMDFATLLASPSFDFVREISWSGGVAWCAVGAKDYIPVSAAWDAEQGRWNGIESADGPPSSPGTPDASGPDPEPPSSGQLTRGRRTAWGRLLRRRSQ